MAESLWHPEPTAGLFGSMAKKNRTLWPEVNPAFRRLIGTTMMPAELFRTQIVMNDSDYTMGMCHRICVWMCVLYLYACVCILALKVCVCPFVYLLPVLFDASARLRACTYIRTYSHMFEPCAFGPLCLCFSLHCHVKMCVCTHHSFDWLWFAEMTPWVKTWPRANRYMCVVCVCVLTCKREHPHSNVHVSVTYAPVHRVRGFTIFGWTIGAGMSVLICS
jgi:hypothetical protein